MQTQLLSMGRATSLGCSWTSVWTTTSPHVPVTHACSSSEHSPGDVLRKSPVLTEKVPLQPLEE